MMAGEKEFRESESILLIHMFIQIILTVPIIELSLVTPLSDWPFAEIQ